MEKGKGIRALIPTGMLSGPEPIAEMTPEQVTQVPVDQLSPNPFQPRRQWNQEELAELVESVRAHGILQPLVARRKGAALELVAGERRLTAARQAGLATVPVLLREATDREMLEWALVENLQRANLNAADAAEAYQRLMEEFSLTQEQVAERVGKSRPTVANALRLLSLPPVVLESLRQGEIDGGHARALVSIQNEPALLHAWKRVVRYRLSVRQTEALAAKLTGRSVPRGTSRLATTLDPNLQDLQDQLTRRLSTKVRLRPGKTGGTIEIDYSDEQELDRIFWELLGPR